MKQNILIQIQGAKPKLMHCQDCLVLGTTEDNQFQIHVNPGAPIDTLFTMVFSFLPQLMEQAARISSDDPAAIKEQRVKVYDYVNMLASSALKNFIPDHELHPDLTEEAIFKAENELLEESYNNLTTEQKEELHNNIELAKDSLNKRKMTSSSSEPEHSQLDKDSVENV